MTEQSKNVTFGFRGNGFNEEGVTTIRPKRTRKVHFNQIDGGLARCSIYDRNNNRIIMNESVVNEKTYRLVRVGEYIFLEPKGLFLKSHLGGRSL